MDDLNYKIVKINNVIGKGLVATKDIKAGSVIFEDDAIVSYLNYTLTESQPPFLKRVTWVDYPCTYNKADLATTKDMHSHIRMTFLICKNQDLFDKIKKLQLSTIENIDTGREGLELIKTRRQKYIFGVLDANCFCQHNIFHSDLCHCTICCALFPTVSRINHRCIRYNCEVNNNGSKTRVVAITNIACGEEITRSYTKYDVPSTEIQSEMVKELYGFKCTCTDETEDKYIGPCSLFALMIYALERGEFKEYAKNYIIVDLLQDETISPQIRFQHLIFLLRLYNSQFMDISFRTTIYFSALEILNIHKTKQLSRMFTNNERTILWCMVLSNIMPDLETTYSKNQIETFMRTSPHLSFYSMDVLYTLAAHHPLTSTGIKNILEK